MKKIYVAGPMRGFPECNKASFERAKSRLTEAGWIVFCPSCLNDALSYGHQAMQHPDRTHLNHVFQIDFACLFAADAIALLSGWERSLGATAELALAQVLSLEVLCAETLQPIYVPIKPWHMIKECL